MITRFFIATDSVLEPKLLRAAVYGANDGIITTFAVVAGVAGAGLSSRVILILGIANLMGDGLSMAAGDYLGERSEQRLRKLQNLAYESQGLWRTGLVTFIAFVLAGALPLLPYILAFIAQFPNPHGFLWSSVATGLTLFSVGSIRTLVTKGRWWQNGLEMLFVGAAAASIAYILGDVLEGMVRTS